MPLKNGRLTPRERGFAKIAAATGDVTYAAEKAGYAYPDVNGRAIAARPAVAAEVMRQQQDRLTNEALPIAVQQLIDCMRDTKAPYAAKNQASKIVMDHTLGREGAGSSKEPHEMTPDELSREIARLEAQKVDLAKTVDVEVIPPAAGVFD